MLLENTTAVVTGIGPGMGRDISLSLAREGADIVLVGRSDRHMPSVAAEVEALGRRAICIQADVSEADDCHRVADQVWNEVGPLDILVNYAGFYGMPQMTQSLLPALRAAGEQKGDARVIMVNTMSVQHIEVNHGSYAGSKAALGAVTKTLALELGRDHIRVNSVHPGYIWGESVRIYFEMQAAERGEGVSWQDVYNERAAETALGYLPDSAEISGAVVFFASPLSRCVTGTSLPVNGGHWTAPSA